MPIGGGDYRWRYSSGAKSDWVNLAFDSTPPDQLRFGDFNGDGYTDVFATSPRNDGNLQWQVSFRGTTSYQNLAYDDTLLAQLRFGDFNADGKTDVFALKDIGGGQLGWDVSYSGTTSYHQINSAPTLLSDMQFGDINGDGHTDVFTTVPVTTTPPTFDWFYSSAGSGAYHYMVTRNQSVHDVSLGGDFDATLVDGRGTDFFYTAQRLDGLNQWWFFYYHTSPFSAGDTQLAYDGPIDQLRFGDFNGDGVTDVFTLKQDCTINLPLVVR